MNHKEARNFSKNLNLPRLFGIPNQIQSAEEIRSQKLEQVPFFEQNWEMLLSELEARGLSDISLLHLKQADEASFWIETQYLDFWELLALFD